MHIIFLIFLALSFNETIEAKSKKKTAPTFNTGYGTKPKKLKKKKHATSMSLGVGIGLNFPEIFPIESHLQIGQYISLKLYLVPQIPFNIVVAMPQDKISSQNDIIIEHPAFDVKFKAKYGPLWGSDIKVFPFKESWYLLAGFGQRSLQIKGEVSSRLILRTASTAGTETNTVFTVGADAITRQNILKLGTGFHWRISDRLYFDLILAGVTKPTSTSSGITVTTNITNPNAPDQKISDALAQFKLDKEAELQEKALKEMSPIEDQILPIIGISIGVYI